MELMLRQSRKEIKSMKNILISKNEWKNAQVTHCLIENIETTHRRCLNSYTQTGAGGGGRKKMHASGARKETQELRHTKFYMSVTLTLCMQKHYVQILYICFVFCTERKKTKGKEIKKLSR